MRVNTEYQRRCLDVKFLVRLMEFPYKEFTLSHTKGTTRVQRYGVLGNTVKYLSVMSAPFSAEIM